MASVTIEGIVMDLLKNFTYTVRTRRTSGPLVDSVTFVAAGHSRFSRPGRSLTESVTFYTLAGAVLRTFPAEDIVSIRTA